MLLFWCLLKRASSVMTVINKHFQMEIQFFASSHSCIQSRHFFHCLVAFFITLPSIASFFCGRYNKFCGSETIISDRDADHFGFRRKYGSRFGIKSFAILIWNIGHWSSSSSSFFSPPLSRNDPKLASSSCRSNNNNSLCNKPIVISEWRQGRSTWFNLYKRSINGWLC